MNVVLDTETGGLVAGIAPVISIAIIPLTDNFHPDGDIPAFLTNVCPPEHMFKNIDPFALSVNHHLTDPKNPEEYRQAIDKIRTYPSVLTTIKAFAEWYKTYSGGKLLSPLAHNWAFDFGMLSHSWFNINRSPDANIGKFFNYQAKCTQALACAMIDTYKVKGQTPPFRYPSLKGIAEAFEITNPAPHTAEGDALTTAAIYRKFIGVE